MALFVADLDGLLVIFIQVEDTQSGLPGFWIKGYIGPQRLVPISLYGNVVPCRRGFVIYRHKNRKGAVRQTFSLEEMGIEPEVIKTRIVNSYLQEWKDILASAKKVKRL